MGHLLGVKAAENMFDQQLGVFLVRGRPHADVIQLLLSDQQLVRNLVQVGPSEDGDLVLLEDRLGQVVALRVDATHVCMPLELLRQVAKHAVQVENQQTFLLLHERVHFII